MNERTILIVEDEPDIARLVDFNARAAGFRTMLAGDGYEALDLARKAAPDLVILDIMLPGLDGLGVLKAMRKEAALQAVPVVMLTAKSEEVDRVVGFELGADDYVVKPFSPRELILRIKAVLNRGARPAGASAERLESRGVQLDLDSHQATLDGEPLALTVTEYKLLAEIIRSKGRVLSREQLLQSVWGVHYAGYDRTVDTHVRRLRAKLGQAADMVETVRGVGYKLKS
jgi:two-component system phosphate regulon response regulator PhoB